MTSKNLARRLESLEADILAASEEEPLVLQTSTILSQTVPSAHRVPRSRWVSMAAAIASGVSEHPTARWGSPRSILQDSVQDPQSTPGRPLRPARRKHRDLGLKLVFRLFGTPLGAVEL